MYNKSVKQLLTLSLLTAFALILFINRDLVAFRIYMLKQPCGIIFSNDFSLWNENQKAGVLEACEVYKNSGNSWVFYLRPTFAYVNEGAGGAFTSKNAILFSMHSVDDPKIFKSTALHELAHLIDIRSGGLSGNLQWLTSTDWVCGNGILSDCVHSCKQYPDKAFYCSSQEYEVLPSRFGTPAYDSTKADVSVNPAEDFAESARYFFEANDELSKTSFSRCKYMKNLFWKAGKTACFDCDIGTVCK